MNISAGIHTESVDREVQFIQPYKQTEPNQSRMEFHQVHHGIVVLLLVLHVCQTGSVPVAFEGDAFEYFEPEKRTRSDAILSEAGFIAGEAFCQCGRPTHRVIDFQDERFWSSQNDIPWTATFVQSDEIFCTGVLLNTLYILTAANCVHNMKPEKILIALNEDDHLPTNETIKALEKYSVSKVIIHPKYNESTRKSDVALVRLSEPINFFEKLLSPVCVPVKNDVYFKKYNGTVTKWAKLETLDTKGPVESSVSSITAQSKLTLPLISNQQCNTETNHKGLISEDLLCAGYLDNSETCKGDSGGPMTIKKGDRHLLVGIASWGDGCSVAYSPSIYTRVGRYVNWILRNTEDAEWCTE